MVEGNVSIVLDGEEELRQRMRKREKIGCLLLPFFPLLPFVVFLIQYSVTEEVVMLVFIIFPIPGFIGLIFVGYYRGGGTMFFRSLDVLKLLGPPDPKIIGQCAVIDRNPVYGIISWNFNGIIFVALHQPERSFDKKMKIPKIFRIWEFKHEIAGIKLARRVGEFTIPTGPDEYYSGTGIIYALVVVAGSFVQILKKVTPNQLNQIVDKLRAEISGEDMDHGFDDF